MYVYIYIYITYIIYLIPHHIDLSQISPKVHGESSGLPGLILGIKVTFLHHWLISQGRNQVQE